MKYTEIIHCRGHENVLSLHKSTFEITKEETLTLTGDCIVGICADKGAADLSDEFKSALRSPGAVLTTTLEANGITASITAKGTDLPLTHPTDFVWRKSDFICGRTIAVHADKAARDLPRGLISELKKGAEMTVTLTVQTDEPQ
ncbi:MAG TPA: DUF371 domain-containing protein [Methanocorpusculum sp.]|nr:DUF371 domain-containing protein [Methanocorpusculum sp.]